MLKRVEPCPYCNTSLIPGETHCPECDWEKTPSVAEKAAPQNSEASRRAHFRCAYRVSEEQCPLDGTTSYDLGAKCNWYCSGHARCSGSPKLGEACLLDNIMRYAEILESRRDWRDIELEAVLSTVQNLNSVEEEHFDEVIIF